VSRSTRRVLGAIRTILEGEAASDSVGLSLCDCPPISESDCDRVEPSRVVVVTVPFERRDERGRAG
jgi:hypothetical protein